MAESYLAGMKWVGVDSWIHPLISYVVCCLDDDDSVEYKHHTILEARAAPDTLRSKSKFVEDRIN